mmetsp:Transcript_9617/g.23316  ORF Transcript_9617/g.23316 Transcript_9617/m.23316 type:complete len:202 (+) Transcript_9617:92-697(+)
MSGEIRQNGSANLNKLYKLSVPVLVYSFLTKHRPLFFLQMKKVRYFSQIAHESQSLSSSFASNLIASKTRRQLSMLIFDTADFLIVFPCLINEFCRKIQPQQARCFSVGRMSWFTNQKHLFTCPKFFIVQGTQELFSRNVGKFVQGEVKVDKWSNDQLTIQAVNETSVPWQHGSEILSAIGSFDDRCHKSRKGCYERSKCG